MCQLGLASIQSTCTTQAAYLAIGVVKMHIFKKEKKNLMYGAKQIVMLFHFPTAGVEFLKYVTRAWRKTRFRLSPQVMQAESNRTKKEEERNAN